MRASWAVPVIASILILGTLGLSQESFAAINISLCDKCDPIEPILKPMNFTVTNTGKNPITLTRVSIFLDENPDARKIQPFTIDLGIFLKPLESFDFISLLFDKNGDLVEPGTKTKISVTFEEVELNPRDADNPKIKTGKSTKNLKT